MATSPADLCQVGDLPLVDAEQDKSKKESTVCPHLTRGSAVDHMGLRTSPEAEMIVPQPRQMIRGLLPRTQHAYITRPWWPRGSADDELATWPMPEPLMSTSVSPLLRTYWHSNRITSASLLLALKGASKGTSPPGGTLPNSIRTITFTLVRCWSGSHVFPISLAILNFDYIATCPRIGS